MNTLRRVFLLSGLFILTIPLSLLVAQQPEGYYLFKGNYPDNVSPFWGDNHVQTSGIAHDDANWFIVGLQTCEGTDTLAGCVAGRPNGNWGIWKIPVGRDLADPYAAPPDAMIGKSQVPKLAAYDYAGDADRARHNGTDYLAVIMTGKSAKPAIVFFRCDDLSYVNYALLDTTKQTDGGWCAIHPVTGELYTSRVHADAILRYSIDWGKLSDTTRHDALTFIDGASISLLHNVQGGEFTPSGKLLYVNSGAISCNPPYFGDAKLYPEDGLHAFETTNWHVVENSITTMTVVDNCTTSGCDTVRRAQAGCFNYTFDNSGCSGEEPKGLTIWDLDDGRAPNVGGQLHVVSYNHGADLAEGNRVILKHYATVKVDAGRDTTVECKSPGTTMVKLSAKVMNGSLCGQLMLVWSAHGVVLDDSTSPTPVGQFPEGTTTVTVTVTEGSSTATDTLLVRVVDTTPPVITLKPDISIWPPNHSYHTFTERDFIASVKDKCDDTVHVSLVSVSSNEPDNAKGDGNTTSDIVVTCPSTVDLRAEREGGGNGRLYTITFAAVDNAGNRSTASAHVIVPHDQSGHRTPGGPALYTVTTNCDTVTTTTLNPQDVKNSGASSQAPEAATLLQNYPNPFNPATSIQFTLNEPQFVVLKIYDLVGREITTLISGELATGPHVAVWNAEQYSSGVYYYRLQTGSTVYTRKLLLMK